VLIDLKAKLMKTKTEYDFINTTIKNDTKEKMVSNNVLGRKKE